MNIHDIYRPILRHFRTKRMQDFSTSFALTSETTVLDVGGSAFNWSLIDVRPQVTLLNIDFSGPPPDGMRSLVADGTQLPFADNSFDVVYSNSVIEHLGDRASQEAFATEARRVGRRHYVQTPNHWFPVEPHYLTPLIHYVPRRLRGALLRNFTVWGLVTRPTPLMCRRRIAELRLLTHRDVRSLFPQSQILRERFLGLTKAFTAVGRGD